MVERANFLECLLIYFDKWGLALMLVLTLESDSIAMAMVPPITKPWVEVRGKRYEGRGMSLSWRDGLESGATVLVGMKSPTQWEYLQCFALFIQIIRSQCGREGRHTVTSLCCIWSISDYNTII